MSMTESEAIRRLKDHFRVHDDGRPTPYLDEAVSMAIHSLEEIQQYREYREIFESHFTEDALELFSDKEEFSKWFNRGKWHVLKCDELGREVEQYRAIGTVSEFRELAEKAKPKKTIEKQKPYSEEVGFNSDMLCPNCGAYVGYWMEGMGTETDQMKYCCDCGQHLANDLEDKEAR